MNEDFVTFELAKKLKDKGYPQVEKNTLAMYDEDGYLSCLCPTLDINRYYYCFEDFDKHDYVAPTISQVLKWLREEKKIYIMVDRSFSVRGWHYYIIDDDDFENPIQQEVEHNRCYEQAAIAGIEYSLDNLI